MSNISTIYNSLVIELEGIFPNKTRMHNPYNLENNPDICKKDSWGLKVLEAEHIVNEFCSLSIKRSFTAVVMKNFITLSSKDDGFDAVSVSILEDQQSICQLLYSPTEIGEGDIIDMIEIASISGIQEMTSEEKRYLFSEVNFNILISESVS